jgi:flagellar biosynthesis/type III secretory pathway chaperone
MKQETTTINSLINLMCEEVMMLKCSILKERLQNEKEKLLPFTDVLAKLKEGVETPQDNAEIFARIDKIIKLKQELKACEKLIK